MEESIHQLIWGYAGMVLAIFGSLGILLLIINYIRLKINSWKYLYKVSKLNIAEKGSIAKFHKLTADYISKIISIKTTNIFKNPFAKDKDMFWWALYNMYINEGPQNKVIKEVQEKEIK